MIKEFSKHIPLHPVCCLAATSEWRGGKKKRTSYEKPILLLHPSITVLMLHKFSKEHQGMKETAQLKNYSSHTYSSHLVYLPVKPMNDWDHLEAKTVSFPSQQGGKRKYAHRCSILIIALALIELLCLYFISKMQSSFIVKILNSYSREDYRGPSVFTGSHSTATWHGWLFICHQLTYRSLRCSWFYFPTEKEEGTTISALSPALILILGGVGRKGRKLMDRRCFIPPASPPQVYCSFSSPY